jgi:hypothetical protein
VALWGSLLSCGRLAIGLLGPAVHSTRRAALANRRAGCHPAPQARNYGRNHRLDEAQLDVLRRELASMSDAVLASTYETYRMACGLRRDGVSRPATIQYFWQVWEECHRRLERTRSDWPARISDGSDLESRRPGQKRPADRPSLETLPELFRAQSRRREGNLRSGHFATSRPRRQVRHTVAGTLYSTFNRRATGVNGRRDCLLQPGNDSFHSTMIRRVK